MVEIVPYQENLRSRGLYDFNDVITEAIHALRSQPLDDPYGLVVVDEVQDFTLLELKLVHHIAGGKPNAPLLLVGDGQQQVYPGGCPTPASPSSAAARSCAPSKSP